ncbi:MAG: hypothetical protein O8C67_06090 [Candidatus Methanoperedens sp.]|nr:hypothetical protein [Candidatus Methanoperedens sp.]
MEIEVTETKTYLEISGAPASTKVEPSETNQIISPESETIFTVEIQEQSAHILQVTENLTTVEVVNEVVSIVEEAAGPIGPQGSPGEPGEFTLSDYVAGEALGGQRVVILHSDAKLYYADKNIPADFNRVLGITTDAVVSGDIPTVRCAGKMTEPTWSWDLDKFLYLSTNGLLTQTPPSSGFLLQMGYPLSTTSIMVDIKIPILIV